VPPSGGAPFIMGLLVKKIPTFKFTAKATTLSWNSSKWTFGFWGGDYANTCGLTVCIPVMFSFFWQLYSVLLRVGFFFVFFFWRSSLINITDLWRLRVTVRKPVPFRKQAKRWKCMKSYNITVQSRSKVILGDMEEFVWRVTRLLRPRLYRKIVKGENHFLCS